MSGKDLTIAIGILVEKVLLLEGKPTQVYDVNVSHKLEILMPQFMQEAKRRGLTIDVTPPPLVVEETFKEIPVDQREQTANLSSR
jgi:hypothetical protein